MNNIIVLSPKVSCESAKKLASVLGADYDNPYKSDKYDYTNYALCVKYGVTAKIKAKKVINKTSAILKSIDKIAFMKALSFSFRTNDQSGCLAVKDHVYSPPRGIKLIPPFWLGGV